MTKYLIKEFIELFNPSIHSHNQKFYFNKYLIDDFWNNKNNLNDKKFWNNYYNLSDDIFIMFIIIIIDIKNINKNIYHYKIN